MRLVYALSLILAFSPFLRAQSPPSRDLNRLMIDQLIAAEDNPTKLQGAFEKYRSGEGCDSVRMAGFLWLVLAQRNPDWEEPFPLLNTPCPAENNVLHYEMAAYAFSIGDLDVMRESAQAALQTAPSPFRTYLAWNLLGTYYQQRQQLDSAYHAFEAGYAAGKDILLEHPDPVGLNNLSNAALMTQQWEHAAEWAKLAEKTYYNALKHGADKFIWGDEFHDQVLSNRLFAEMNLLDSAAAAATFDRMRLHLGTDGNAIMIAATATAYLLWSGRRTAFEDMQEVFQACFAADSALSTEVLGVHALLFEPWKSQWQRHANMPDSDLWDYVSACPVAYRDAAFPRSKELQETQSEISRWGKAGLQWGAAGLWGAALVLGLMRWQRSRQLHATDTGELVRLVNQGLAEGIHGPTRRAFRTLAERYPRFQTGNESSALSSLTEREREILNDWMAQVRPKETAEHIGISPAAVYNLRSQIRRKLRVPEGENVPSWLKRTDPSNH